MCGGSYPRAWGRKLPRVQGQPELQCETVSKEGGGGWTGKGARHQAWRFEFSSWTPHGRRRKPAPTNLSCTLCTGEHTLINVKIKAKKTSKTIEKSTYRLSARNSKSADIFCKYRWLTKNKPPKPLGGLQWTCLGFQDTGHSLCLQIWVSFLIARCLR